MASSAIVTLWLLSQFAYISRRDPCRYNAVEKALKRKIKDGKGDED